ncbi:unnamed protein product [Chironomus riparius]|uniref:Peptidase S1 domain-containing protein n=1 Tax=Chironomus riparius TaxID=315576 RepID=A0A9N9S171_9DIPT|nr:unnamed protein product [Chironomus riparius]
MLLQIVFIIAMTLNEVFGAKISSVNFEEHFYQCGVMSASSGLIQGGFYSKQDQFPWIAIISIKNESNSLWDHNGSGSLVSRRHVLVKSFYVSTLDDNNQYVPISTENVQIFLGTTTYNNLNQEGSIKIGVNNIRLYPHTRKVARGFSVFNFAILTLEDDVTFNDFIKPVCLWNNQLNSRMYTGQQLMAVGYGRDLTGRISKIRKHVPVQVTSSDECETEYIDLLPQIKESRFFCIKEIVKDHGPCKFDTQLYVKIDSTWYLKGEMIAARTDINTLQCYSKFPVAVEDISPYVDWIDQEIKTELIEIYVSDQKDGAIEVIDVEKIVKYQIE